MNNSNHIFRFFCLVLGSFACIIGNAQPNVDMDNIKANRPYRIGSSSVLKIAGSTNVNSFNCNCTEPFSTQYFTFQLDEQDPTTALFQNTKLKVPVKSLDCGNKMMNKDLHKALNGDEFPFIYIELLKVTQDRCSRIGELKGWVKVKALTRITINGKSCEYWLTITARKFAEDSFRFIGSKSLRMSEFDIVPPVAMMGMIKVKDEIKIELDLEVNMDSTK